MSTASLTPPALFTAEQFAERPDPGSLDDRRLAHVYRADAAPRLLEAEDELSIPDILGDFRGRVGRFFE